MRVVGRRNLASPVSYRDYGLVERFRAPGGALVAIVAGARDTGLRGLAPHLAHRSSHSPFDADRR